jgi:preprotein translocase subunit SecB
MYKDEYKVARFSIQLLNVTVSELHVQGDTDKMKDAMSNNNGKLKQNTDIQHENSPIVKSSTSTSMYGFCKMNVEIVDPSIKQKTVYLHVQLVLKGLFIKDKAAKISDETFKKRVTQLTIPLLLPYVKANLQLITGMLSIPSFNLPTIDIIKTINKNSKE